LLESGSCQVLNVCHQRAEQLLHSTCNSVQPYNENQLSVQSYTVDVDTALSQATSSWLGENSMCEVKSKPRRRLRQPAQWAANRRRRARECGLHYVSLTGKVVPAKSPCLDSDLCSCRLKCSDKFPSQSRQQIFDSYYELDENGKNCYIFGCMKAMAPKLKVLQATRHRSVSFLYYVTVDHTEHRICRKAFERLHQITNSKLEHIGKSITGGLSAPKPSSRGKHTNRPHRCSEEDRQNVVEHISMFPAEESHYSRHSNANRKYLSSELNIAKMYRLYGVWCDERGKKKVSGRLYRDIFTTEFNLGFGVPRSDTCSICDKGSEDVVQHKLQADEAFAAMNKDRKYASHNDGFLYLTFDLQKTLPLPKLSTSVSFYLRQLWLYDLGIHVLSKKESRAIFNLWTEDEAGRGCEEVGSALLAFLDTADFVGGHLVAWSDSCCGQNKNFFIICIWQYLIAKRRFDIVDHKFPVPGHSFLDSDRDFAQVEKSVKRCQNIYCVDDYHSLIAQSQTKNKPRVNRLGKSFVCVKELPKLLGLVNRTVNQEGELIHFRDSVRWIRVIDYGKYMYKTSHGDTEDFKTVDICKGSKLLMDAESMQLPMRPQVHHQIKSAKIKDIAKQLDYIPAAYKHYYEAVIKKNSNAACSGHGSDFDSSCEEPGMMDIEPQSCGVVGSLNDQLVAQVQVEAEHADSGVVPEQLHSSGQMRRRSPRQTAAKASIVCKTLPTQKRSLCEMNRMRDVGLSARDKDHCSRGNAKEVCVFFVVVIHVCCYLFVHFDSILFGNSCIRLA